MESVRKTRYPASTLPMAKSQLGVSSDGLSSLVGLTKMDPVLNPVPLSSLGEMAGRAAEGVLVMA